MFQRLRIGTKSGFDKQGKGIRALDKLGPSVNKPSNKLGSEAFCPTTLDKESEKAARILRSFCKDGFYIEEEVQPNQKQKVIKKIPEEVIRNAKGLAIFTTMRTGLWISGAGGSGVLVARKPDGTWSCPSGIMLHTAGLRFLVGVDIYDCMLVLNTEQAVEAFTELRCTLGGEVSVTAGPVGLKAVLETAMHKSQAAIFTYLKSRGFYADVQLDGTIVIERTDENERFYGEGLPAKDILAGKVRHPPYESTRLMETIKAAQGDTDYNETMMPDGPPPGDYEIEDGNMFGVPDKEDPDPYGVLALEKEGMSLREAGTQQRASWEQFSFNPAPTSPIHSIYARSSQDGGPRTISNRNSWRNTLNSESKTPSSLRNSFEARSITSGRSVKSPMADSSTQTEFAEDLPSPQGGRCSVRSSQHSSKGSLTTLPHTIHENGVLDDKQMTPDAAESFRPVEESVVPSKQPVAIKEEDSVAASKEKPVASIEQKPVESTEEKPVEPIEEPRAIRPDPIIVSTNNGYNTPPATPPAVSDEQRVVGPPSEYSDDEDEDTFSSDEYDDDDLQIIEEPIVHSVQTMKVQTPSSHAFPAARVVVVPKRLPPALPARNPNRARPVVVGSIPDAQNTATAVPDASPAERAALADQDALRSKLPAWNPETNSSNSIPEGRSKSDPHFPLSDPRSQPLGSTPDVISPANSVASQELHEAERSPARVQKIPGGFD